ncbi:MAG: type II toxin-antitoxin system VapC family toxin [Actinobacteria bacterium]|nr:type II toxin-antitoxin system VapC family toxin [Actinomycetota bacterium]
MRLLLDTHALLWWLADAPLSTVARDLIADPTNVVYVSAASGWEISVKTALGKLVAPDDLESSLTDCNFDSLPISFSHALAAGRLPPHHRDPFDRMLIAQAQHEGLTLITRDPRFEPYDVTTLRA